MNKLNFICIYEKIKIYMRGAWGDELIIKSSIRTLASIAFMVKWEADPEVGSPNPGEYEIKRKKSQTCC